MNEYCTICTRYGYRRMIDDDDWGGWGYGFMGIWGYGIWRYEDMGLVIWGEGGEDGRWEDEYDAVDMIRDTWYMIHDTYGNT